MVYIDLLFNLAAMVAASAISGLIDKRFDRKQLLGKIFQGVLFGIAAIVGMLHPYALTEGVFFDGRSVVISLSAFFFGPVSGAITVAMAIVFRASLGGEGVLPGFSTMLISLAVGYLFFNYRKRKKILNFPLSGLFLMGCIVHILIAPIFIFMMKTHQSGLTHLIGVAVLFIYPFATWLIGKILLDQEVKQLLFNKLSDSEMLFRTTFYSIGDGVITTDRSGKIMHINPIAEKLTGFSESDSVGKDISSIIKLIDVSSLQEIENPIFTALAQNKPTHYDQLFIEDSNGRQLPIIQSSAPIMSKNDGIAGAVMVFNVKNKDIDYQSELLNSAISYKSLFNSISGSAYIQDREGRFVDVNDAAVVNYGYPREKFIGQTPDFLAAEGRNDLAKIKTHIEAAFNGTPQQFEFWGKKANGEIFPKQVNLFKSYYFKQDVIFAFAQDISERKKSEIALVASEERYRTLFNSIPVGVLLEDLEGTILDVNDTFCIEQQYTREELIGKNIEFVVHPQHKSKIKSNIETIVRDKYLNSKIETYNKFHQLRVLDLSEKLIDLPDGRRGILSISRNITEQVIAEKTLQKSEARYRAIIAATPDMFFRFDKESRFIDFVSENTLSLFASPELFLGKKAADILPADLAQLTMTSINKALKTGELVQYEYQLTINNQLKWFDSRMVKSGAEEVLVIVRDITDRKAAEINIQEKSKLIETLLESIPSPLFYMNNKGEFLGVNKAFRELFENSEIDIIGKKLVDIEDYHIALRNMQSDKLIFTGAESLQVIERLLILPSGEQRNVILTKSPFHDSTGKIAGLIGLFNDITARKAMEEELILAKDKAEESDRLKASFLNNLNHEIRTPLNAIVGFSNLLFDDFTENEKLDFVYTINNNAEQLLRIIDDVLAVSRLEAETIPLQNESFSPDDLLRDLQLTFLSACIEKGLSLVIEPVPENTIKTLYTDKGKLRQILTCFLSNAIKYTEQGSITIGRSASEYSIRFYVKDTGIGIPEDEHAKVYNRFFRGRQPQIRAIRGTGLGLSIAQGMAKLMDGNIALEAEQGSGSTFWVELPLTQHTALDVKTTSPSYSLHAAMSSLNLLIAEDEQDNFDFLQIVLSENVKSISRAKTGLEAVEMMRLTPFDMVLMDIKMPVMNGYEASKIISSEFPRATIIGLTAYSQPDEIKQAIDSGCAECLSKPISKEKLLSTLNYFCVSNGK